MRAGVATSVDKDGNVVSARLMGSPDQCCQLDWPYHRWCILPFPHDGEHEYNLERTGRLLFAEE